MARSDWTGRSILSGGVLTVFSEDKGSGGAEPSRVLGIKAAPGPGGLRLVHNIFSHATSQEVSLWFKTPSASEDGIMAINLFYREPTGTTMAGYSIAIAAQQPTPSGLKWFVAKALASGGVAVGQPVPGTTIFTFDPGTNEGTYHDTWYQLRVRGKIINSGKTAQIIVELLRRGNSSLVSPPPPIDFTNGGLQPPFLVFFIEDVQASAADIPDGTNAGFSAYKGTVSDFIRIDEVTLGNETP